MQAQAPVLSRAARAVQPLFEPEVLSLLSLEMARRERAKSHDSQVLDPASPFYDLWKPAQYKTYYGGRGAAKDWSFAEVLLRRMARDDKHPCPFPEGWEEPFLVLCTREYQNSIADSVHRVIRRMILRLGYEKFFDPTEKVIRSVHGDEFIFKGLHHNVEEIKSTEGVKITWVAEAQNTTEESWRELLPTVFRVDGAEVWTSFNVTDLTTPTHVRMVTKPPEGAIVKMVNFTDNKHFPAGLRTLMEQDRARDPLVYQHIWMGKPRQISSAVIMAGRYKVASFAADLWKKAARLFFGADFGYASDPSVIVRDFVLTAKQCEALGLFKTDNSGVADFQNGDGSWNKTSDRLFKEYEAGGTGIEIDELPALYDTIPGSRDWYIKADAARPEIISFLKGKGFKISAAEKWNGSVEDGIAHIRSHIVIIHPRCVQSESEYATYSYKVDPRVIDPKTNAPQVLPIIIDAHNHFIDSDRYSMDGYIQRRGSLGVWEKLGKT